MRSGYGAIKLLAFTLLALAAGLKAGDIAGWTHVADVGLAAAWLATALCVLRGLPVILDAGHLFRSADTRPSAPPIPHRTGS
jgi:hypothetical protein